MPQVAEMLSTRTLVLGMVQANGTIDGAELYALGEACGFTVHQIRLCIARLVQEGSFAQEGRGRKAVLTMTAKGSRALEPEPELLRMALLQDAGVLGWDGQWHLVGFSVEEELRPARNALREYIVDVLGGAPLFGGLYASANDWDDLVRATAKDLGVEDRVLVIHTSFLDVGGTRDPRDVAAQLWDLDTVGRDWRAFVKTYAREVDALEAGRITDPMTALAGAVRLITDFSAIILRDPVLPPELRPRGWAGAEARDLLVRGTRQVSSLRSQAKVPALFRRFDRVMSEADPTHRDDRFHAST
jgi:phenylacetic acid degradation operon negative regulatory protein